MVSKRPEQHATSRLQAEGVRAPVNEAPETRENSRFRGSGETLNISAGSSVIGMALAAQSTTAEGQAALVDLASVADVQPIQTDASSPPAPHAPQPVTLAAADPSDLSVAPDAVAMDIEDVATAEATAAEPGVAPAPIIEISSVSIAPSTGSADASGIRIAAPATGAGETAALAGVAPAPIAPTGETTPNLLPIDIPAGETPAGNTAGPDAPPPQQPDATPTDPGAGVTDPVVEAVTGGGGLVDGVTGTVGAVIDTVTGDGGLVGTVTDTVGTVLDAVTGDGGLVEGVTGTVETVLDAVTGDGGLVDGVTGTVGAVIDTVTGEDGLVGTVTDTLTGTVETALDVVTGDGGLADTLTGAAGAALDLVTGEDGLVGTVTGTTDTLTDTIGTVLGVVTDGDGLLDGLTDALTDSLGAGFLDSLLGLDGSLNLLGTDEILSSVLDSSLDPILGDLLSDDGILGLDLGTAPAIIEDPLVALTGDPELSGALVDEGLVGSGADPLMDIEIVDLLTEILSSGESAIDGIVDVFGAVLDPNDAILDDPLAAEVEQAVSTLIEVEGPDEILDVVSGLGDGSLLGGLNLLPDDDHS